MIGCSDAKFVHVCKNLNVGVYIHIYIYKDMNATYVSRRAGEQAIEYMNG